MFKKGESSGYIERGVIKGGLQATARSQEGEEEAAQESSQEGG